MLEWVIGLMLQLQPNSPWIDTYFDTAIAITEAAEQSPLFRGDDGAKQTAAILVSLSWFESRFQPDAVGDNGSSCGAFQIQPRTSTRYTCAELQDPAYAAGEAIRLIRQSFRVCAARPLPERLAWFAGGGSCVRGIRESKHRMALAKRLAK